MTGDYCRCPGCGACAASTNQKKLKLKLRRLDANEAAMLKVIEMLLENNVCLTGETSARALITRIEAERNEK